MPAFAATISLASIARESDDRGHVNNTTPSLRVIGRARCLMKLGDEKDWYRSPHPTRRHYAEKLTHHSDTSIVNKDVDISML